MLACVAAEISSQLKKKQTKKNPVLPVVFFFSPFAADCQREREKMLSGDRKILTIIRQSAWVIKVVLACCFDLSAGYYVPYFSDVISCAKYYLHGSCIVVLLRGRVAVRKYKAG